MHNLWGFYIFFKKSLFTENYFLIAAINLTILGPLYTCLVSLLFAWLISIYQTLVRLECLKTSWGQCKLAYQFKISDSSGWFRFFNFFLSFRYSLPCFSTGGVANWNLGPYWHCVHLVKIKIILLFYNIWEFLRMHSNFFWEGS